jgi:cytoplasmic iron level regulating protein YaaA (DUF328/UPF0246 family)
MKHIALVSCVSKKTHERNKASDLYISTWFKKCKNFVDKEYDNWYILSAKYGLIHHSDVIEPYDITLSQMPQSQRILWGNEICDKLNNLYSQEVINIDIYAGKLYRKYIIKNLDKFEISYRIPLIGMGIGEQLKELSRLSK